MLEFMTQNREQFDFRLAWKRIADLCNQILTHYFWITRIRLKCPQDEGLLRAYPTIDNATLESSLLSIRGLDDFFGNLGTRVDDLNARDFSGFPASSSFLTKEHREDINKSIAHITTTRLDPEQTKYPYQVLLGGAIPRCVSFIDFVLNSGKVRDCNDATFLVDTRNILKRIQVEYVDRASK
jgi:hypothetical protein